MITKKYEAYETNFIIGKEVEEKRIYQKLGQCIM